MASNNYFKSHFFLGFFVWLNCCAREPTTPIFSPTIDGWTLVWNDEFSEPTLDTSKWDSLVDGSGGGNNEAQYYTGGSKNIYLENGALIIVAKKESFQGKSYTSAKLSTKNKGDWIYGHIEVRAKLPTGIGIWPAIWMLPTDTNYGNWPASGEIDIMENVGFEPNIVHGATHSYKYNHKLGTSISGKVNSPDASIEFHIYSVTWISDRIDFFVDGKKYFSSTNDGTGWQSWPFDKRFYLILNIAVGGSWGAVNGIDDSIFPQKMEIDYVRIYK
jgi:beta-glucanase (GH16 family)